MKKEFFIGVDVGGTKISAALVDERGKIFARFKTPTPLKGKPSIIQEAILNVIEEILLDNALSSQNIKAVGIGIPGVVTNANEILATPNINLAGFPLIRGIQKKIKIRVAAGNDVNLGLLGEQWLGAGKGMAHVVGIFPGTGVGGAIIIGGKLFTGSQGAAAEIGHMIVDRNGPLCTCGNSGCLEAVAGRWAIERDLRQAIKAGRPSLIKEITGNLKSPIKSKILKTALKDKDRLATEIMTRVSETLGKACVSIRHIFNPDLIILGGGVIEACGDFMLPIINCTFHQDPFFKKIDHCRIMLSRLGDDAVILGAVALVKNPK